LLNWKLTAVTAKLCPSIITNSLHPLPQCRSQVLRVHEHWTQPTGPDAAVQHYGRRDSRDNNWLLLECVLALPLALGLWTSPVSLMLAVSLLGEAVMHWQWWGFEMPTWHFRQTIREGFFVNAAVAGGLVLMQSFGGGVLSLDDLLQKQK
jgi:uncharacterized membrane protein YphA (DoxX/SURF4 family)